MGHQLVHQSVNHPVVLPRAPPSPVPHFIPLIRSHFITTVLCGPVVGHDPMTGVVCILLLLFCHVWLLAASLGPAYHSYEMTRERTKTQRMSSKTLSTPGLSMLLETTYADVPHSVGHPVIY